MASSEGTIRIGYVPEHYLTPLHLALKSTISSLPFKVTIKAFPSGTGHMITSLRANEIDIAIGLTEGWVAGLVGKTQLEKGDVDGGYKMVGEWVETPLRWAIVTGRNRNEINGVSDLKGGRVGVSRLGSGSHIMSFVLAQQQNWSSTVSPLRSVILGPFPSLRDGVIGGDPAAPDAPLAPSADFFMWEEFTTKPSFHPSESTPNPPLKKIGEIFTPWPSWHIVASTSTFPSPANDARLSQLFEALDSGIAAFEADREHVVKLLGTGELGCTYNETDVREWLKDVRFVKRGTRGVDNSVVSGVIDILKVADVIPKDIGNNDAIEKVVGISK
ncbi:alpha 1,3-glucosidase [Blastomyces dermatitidis ER-3]|uniref:Alpha 1,3-glucosidase n=1 Tax=Ajellomyces dermatitidis (strain ER-3 / ATCC MYA-2586) TaxID=559297 RepID=A0ABP2F1Q5_AJEDR|nr:alpha 1,3-glucosidase [Blastomyces dermatitidis ER-3]EEQ89258.1 alpha 1,3-glucosidase [Blastomyces dermatitidis ER-3]